MIEHGIYAHAHASKQVIRKYEDRRVFMYTGEMVVRLEGFESTTSASAGQCSEAVRYQQPADRVTGAIEAPDAES